MTQRHSLNNYTTLAEKALQTQNVKSFAAIIRNKAILRLRTLIALLYFGSFSHNSYIDTLKSALYHVFSALLCSSVTQYSFRRLFCECVYTIDQGEK